MEDLLQGVFVWLVSGVVSIVLDLFVVACCDFGHLSQNPCLAISVGELEAFDCVPGFILFVAVGPGLPYMFSLHSVSCGQHVTVSSVDVVVEGLYLVLKVGS